MIFAALEKGDWFVCDDIYAIKTEKMETEIYIMNAISLKTGVPLNFAPSDRVIKIKMTCLDNFVDI